MIISAQSSGTQSTSSANWTAIPGLSLTLPRGAGDSALVIITLGAPYAQGDNFPGGNVGIQVAGVVQSAYASYTYNEKVPPSTGRMPTTLSLTVPLSQTGDLQVVGVWQSIRGSKLIIDSPATLTAVVA